jgi:hypothetical protein
MAERARVETSPNLTRTSSSSFGFGSSEPTISMALVGVSLCMVRAGAASASQQAVLTPMSGSYVFRLTFDGMARDYRLHVPPAATDGKPLPLVLNLHGATQNAWLEEITSSMDPSADRSGYLVAYPDGTRISKVLTPDPVAKQAQYGWNAGACCGLPVTKRVDSLALSL